MILPVIGIFSLHTGSIEAERCLLDSFWYFWIISVDHPFFDHVFSDRVEYRTCSAHSRDILHRCLISIPHPYTDDSIWRISDRPIIMEIGTGSRLHRERNRGIQDTRYPEGSCPIVLIREDICEEKVGSMIERREVSIGEDDIFEGHFDRSERYPVSIVSCIVIE